MSTITREQAHAISDLKAGYTLGNADVAILNELARIALASLEAEPVAFINGAREPVLYGAHIGIAIATQLYAAPPTPVSVPDEATPENIEILASTFAPRGVTYQWDRDECNAAADSWNACRAAMLQGADGNSPVIPDGWVACSERMPTPNQYVLVCNGVWVGMGMHSDSEHIEDDERWQDEHHEFIDLLHHPVTHWMPLPAAPQQEA